MIRPDQLPMAPPRAAGMSGQPNGMGGGRPANRQPNGMGDGRSPTDNRTHARCTVSLERLAFLAWRNVGAGGMTAGPLSETSVLMCAVICYNGMKLHTAFI